MAGAGRMRVDIAPGGDPRVELLRALSDPIRWDIVRQAAEVSELACSVLEARLGVARPTITYHTKILVQAGLFAVRKEGRNIFYTLQRDQLRAVINEVRTLIPGPQALPADEPPAPARTVQRRRAVSDSSGAGAQESPALLTW
jgi:DNA-binding transcriptional ArsR family regulator